MNSETCSRGAVQTTCPVTQMKLYHSSPQHRFLCVEAPTPMWPLNRRNVVYYVFSVSAIGFKCRGVVLPLKALKSMIITRNPGKRYSWRSAKPKAEEGWCENTDFTWTMYLYYHIFHLSGDISSDIAETCVSIHQTNSRNIYIYLFRGVSYNNNSLLTFCLGFRS